MLNGLFILTLLMIIYMIYNMMQNSNQSSSFFISSQPQLNNNYVVPNNSMNNRYNSKNVIIIPLKMNEHSQVKNMAKNKVVKQKKEEPLSSNEVNYTFSELNGEPFGSMTDPAMAYKNHGNNQTQETCEDSNSALQRNFSKFLI